GEPRVFPLEQRQARLVPSSGGAVSAVLRIAGGGRWRHAGDFAAYAAAGRHCRRSGPAWHGNYRNARRFSGGCDRHTAAPHVVLCPVRPPAADALLSGCEDAARSPCTLGGRIPPVERWSPAIKE